ncbi:hypothetical protein DFH09DRAFT_1335923 [Mycena vulgaris]|nr:hypothetical protein DFH09DRAFT_1335923 [Mycena vulgaris]
MLAATTSPTDHPLLRPCPPHKLPIDMASPPSTKRRRTSSSSSPLPPPLDLAAVDTAIRTPRQPPSRRHRPATHPCYYRCPSRPQHPDGAVLIDLAIGLRSLPPPSASAAASARRETRPQIARRHPAPRIVYDGDKDRKDEEATEGGLEAEKREEGEREGRESRKKGNRTERKSKAVCVVGLYTPAVHEHRGLVTTPEGRIPRAHPLAMHEFIGAHARWASARDVAMREWAPDGARDAATSTSTA